MAHHAEITRRLDMPVYFCEKASPWQRPTNEHTNGLLRQYFREALSSDRRRIARDLHDLVIQRLFAAGLSLQRIRR